MLTQVTIYLFKWVLQARNALDPVCVRHSELCRPGGLAQPLHRGAAGAARAVLCGCGGAAMIARVLRVC